MRKIGLAAILALCFVLTISFGVLASTGTQTFRSSKMLKISNTSKTLRPAGSCTINQSGRLIGNALTVTATLLCAPGLVVGTINTVAKHCSFSLFGICFSYDKTVTIINNCIVTPNRGPTCVATGIIAASGQWDVTTTGFATTSDGGTGSGSTTATINK